MTDSYDTIVIGAGHNGLVCATYLAEAGMKVLVVEAAAQAGGACITREFAEGFSVSAGAHSVSQLHPDIFKELKLEANGLSFAAKDLKTIALAEDGKHLSFFADSVAGENLGDDDRLSYAQLYNRMQRYAGILAETLKKRPPKIIEGDITDKLNLLKLGLGIRLLGKDDMRELMRIGTMNMYDILEEHFDDDLLKGALAFDAVLGSHMGPRSPNTVLTYIHRQLNDLLGYKGPAIPNGGMGSVTQAMARAAQNAGVEIQLNSCVKRINIDSANAMGVELADGSIIKSERVVSNADPKKTFRDLVTYPLLDTGFSRRIENIRTKSDTAKLHLALNSLPDFSGLTDLGQRMLIAPSATYVERAFDHSKYGEYSQAPAMEILLPSVHDQSLAPEGKHVMSVIVQYAPFTLRTGWNADSKEAFEQVILQQLSKYAPDLTEHIHASELLTPADMEAEFRITGGHWHHCELALDQIAMMRPAFNATQYATPIDGLYLCGAGCHPGGNVMGMAGKNAASAIIKEQA